MKGRKRIPTSRKRLNGNQGKRRLKKEPKLPVLTGVKPPETLTDEARLEWNRLIKPLINSGVLKMTDLQIFSAYCHAVGAMTKLQKKIQGVEGFTEIGARGGHTVAAEYRAYLQTVDLVKKLASELGLSPASRARLAPEEPDDEKEELLD